MVLFFIVSSSVLISGQYWSYQKNIGHIKLMFQMFGKHSTVRPYQLGLFVGGGEIFSLLIKTFHLLYDYPDSVFFFLNSALLGFLFFQEFLDMYVSSCSFFPKYFD